MDQERLTVFFPVEAYYPSQAGGMANANYWVAKNLLRRGHQPIVFFYAHYAFASITAHVMAMFVPFLLVTVAVGAPVGLTVLLLAYFANLSAGLTHYGTTPAPVYFGTGYVTQKRWWTVGLIASVLNIAIWATVGSVWWMVLGWW